MPGARGLFIAIDGEHVLAEALAAFAEAETLEQVGYEYGDVYEFSRTSGGWTAEEQDPPQDLYPFHTFELASRLEPSRSVWAVPGQLPPGTPREPLWLRESSGEYVLREGRTSFVPIGPVTSPDHEEPPLGTPYGYVTGISSDLAHIVVRADAEFKQTWPGDPTAEGPERGSLYEYHGTAGGEPVLVGVMNSGRAPWRAGATHVNEGAQLASECGTLYDGMSASGERVFFTAQHQPGCVGSQPPVDELFARVDGSETIAISEPSKANCEACDTEGVPGEARFAGASEDGAIVYFTSEQELLPGAYGDSLYEFDFNAAPGRRVALVAPNTAQVVRSFFERETVITPVARVSNDGTRVYFDSTAVLPGASNENGSGEAAAQGQTNLYVFDTESGTVSFVADGEGIKSFDTTNDGEYLAFSSPARLAEANGETTDTSTVPQLFEYDATTGAVVRVSKGQESLSGYWCPATGALEGFNCDGNTTIGENEPHLAREGAMPNSKNATGEGFTPPPSLDEHGAVVFSSELPLTPGAVQGRSYRAAESGAIVARAENVYEYRDGQVYLISAAAEATALHYRSLPEEEEPLVGIDESGRDIFFTTVDQVSPQDGDTQSNWYDAREDGGFPPVSTQLACGETCQSSVPAGPALSTPLTPPTAGDNVDPRPSAPPATHISTRPNTKRICRRRDGHKRKGVGCSAATVKGKGNRSSRKSTSKERR